MAEARALILQALNDQRGILFFKPMLVGRISYCGRDILAPNSDPATHGDERGYVLVERWIASKTVAGNDKPKEGEGLSKLILPGDRAQVCTPLLSTFSALKRPQILWKDAVELAEKELVGKK